jgi:hypothetical protein
MTIFIGVLQQRPARAETVDTKWEGRPFATATASIARHRAITLPN